jgi:PAS domain S-box-containing protein
MQAAIITVIILLHAAFGCMFLFMSRREGARFARLMAQSWLLEAVRAGIVLSQLGLAGQAQTHWHTLSDCLGLLATWWLLAACADLAGVRLPARLGAFYVGLGAPLIMAFRYLGPVIGERWLGLSPESAGHYSVLVELALLFVTITVARAAVLAWLARIWRRTRLPGAMLAVVFAVPYVAFALMVPLQFHYNYYPEWYYHLWAARVIGFSLGLVMLLFDQQLSAHRSSEARMRRFMDSNIQGVLLCNFRGEITDANDAFLQIVGYTREELKAGRLNWRKLTPPEWAERDEQAVRELGLRGVCQPWEKEYLRKDGTRVPVLVGVAMIEGSVDEALAFVLDISGLKAAEARARHLANFPELNPNPVLEFNADGQVAYSNPAAHAMVTRLGQDRLEQLLPADARNIVRQCLDTGEPRLRLVTTHGKTTLSWSFYPISSHRVVHCYIGDITERTELELQLRQAQKMEAIGQLAGGVAHDFNNLLTAIIGHLGLLQTGRQLPPDMAESLAAIAHAAGRATNLTSQLLAFSRQQVIDIRPLDLNEIVAHHAKMLRRLLGEDIAMHLDFARERLFFNGDSGMIEQVVMNLVVNARDAMPGGGRLDIATGAERRIGRTVEGRSGEAPPGSFVRLSITDTGTGIPPEILPKIFEPFFTTKEVGKGTGLGLATAFGIVQQHQGWIEVQSDPGRGTTFTIFLPRIAAPAVATPVERTNAPGRGRGETILLVEDEPAVRDIGIRALTAQGYRVLSASDGQSALEAWRTHRGEISLLLTDVIMPGGLSGLQLARQLQAEKPGLQVIYMSGYSREIAGKELPAEANAHYLAKPYELEDLYHLVQTALGHGDGAGVAMNREPNHSAH